MILKKNVNRDRWAGEGKFCRSCFITMLLKLIVFNFNELQFDQPSYETASENIKFIFTDPLKGLVYAWDKIIPCD